MTEQLADARHSAAETYSRRRARRAADELALIPPRHYDPVTRGVIRQLNHLLDQEPDGRCPDCRYPDGQHHTFCVSRPASGSWAAAGMDAAFDDDPLLIPPRAR